MLIKKRQWGKKHYIKGYNSPYVDKKEIMGKKVLEKLLGSKIKIRIIRHLLHSNKGFTLRELGTVLKIDHKSVGTAINDFKELEFVNVEQYGRSYAVTLNKSSKFIQVLEALIEFEGKL